MHLSGSFISLAEQRYSTQIVGKGLDETIEKANPSMNGQEK